MAALPPTTSNISPTTSSTSNAGNAYVFNAQQLQSYIKQRNDLFITKPGYEVYFFSRFDTDSVVDLSKLQYFSGPSNSGSATSVVPTLTLNSDALGGKVAVINKISISNQIGGDGCTAQIVIIQPNGIDYFLPTIGNKDLARIPKTDYDYSPNAPKGQHRIGVMDTVLIKLKNINGAYANEKSNLRETVFRGVVQSIQREKTVNGTMIILTCRDFSLFLQKAMIIKNGIFSTINKALTGRGAVFNVIKYINNLLSGNTLLFDTPLMNNIPGLASNAAPGSSAAQNKIDENQLQYSVVSNDVIRAVPGADAIAGNPTLFQQHAMQIPPLFYLQFAEIVNDSQAFGSQNVATEIQNVVKIAAADTAGIVNSATGNFGNLANLPSLTPEDRESVDSYSIALEDQSTITNQTTANQTVTSALGPIQKLAWVLSDLYLEKFLSTWEHQYVWSVMNECAARGFREVYIDFAPKLSLQSSSSYISASVQELKNNTGQQYYDIHPNIAIVKYRLSPCFLPVRDPDKSSQFWQWKFTDSDIISYSGYENENDVYTAVLAYGFGLDNASLQEAFSTAVFGESKGLSYAHSIDTNIEKRIGYRFLSDHDNKLSIPILRNLTSYVILEKKQMSMFQQRIVIAGNPNIQPGSLVRLTDLNIDYYCLQVTHDWDINNGYTTSLSLNYGHTSGRMPGPLTGYSSMSALASQQCQQNHNALQSAGIKSNEMIGNINVQCFIEALWQYMTNSSTGDLTPFTREAELKQSSKPKPADWIRLTFDDTMHSKNYDNSQGPIISSYDSAILNAISQTNAAQYGITLNLVKNIVFQESSWHSQISGDGGYGWFQLTGKQNQISNQDALTNFNAAALIALQTLVGTFQQVSGTSQGGAAYLKGLQGYNGFLSGLNPLTWDAYVSPPGKSYPRFVLNDSQATSIADGQQSPSTLISGATGSTGGPVWPYYVYGPCGIRVQQANPSIPVSTKRSDPSYIATKQQLLNFNTGITLSATYIRNMLNKFASSGSFPALYQSGGPTQQVFQNIIQPTDQLGKSIAAWYSGEIVDPKVTFDPAFFSNVLSQIKGLYNTCLQCLQTSASYSLTGEASNSNLSINQRILQAALNFKGTSTKNGPDNGANACAFAVNQILSNAGLTPLGSNNVDDCVNALNGGLGTLITNPGQTLAGDLFVQGLNSSGGQNHIGIVIQGSSDPNSIILLSNSSSAGSFSWQTSNGNLISYYQPNLPTGFYRYRSIS